MPTQAELAESCRTFMTALRSSLGLSKVKMADRLFINRKRWAAYEDGTDAPKVTDYVWMCQEFGVNPAWPILEFSKPEIYAGLKPDSATSRKRQACADYIENVATNWEVEGYYFLRRGHHGSDPKAQIAMVVMYNQLDMQQKYMIAEIIDALYRLNKERGCLHCTDEITPDVEHFEKYLEEGRRAAVDGRSGYVHHGG